MPYSFHKIKKRSHYWSNYTLLVFYLDQHSEHSKGMLLITVLTQYPTSKPAFNDLANVLNYFLLHGYYV